MDQTTLIIGKEFPTQVIPLIKTARKSVDIIVFEWRWYPDQVGSSIQQFNHEIIKAVRHNLKVRVLVNSKKILGPLKDCGVDAKKLISKRLLHTKVMLIDNEMVILGSHNYTMNAFTINHEVSVIIHDKDVVKRLITYFENLWL